MTKCYSDEAIADLRLALEALAKEVPQADPTASRVIRLDLIDAIVAALNAGHPLRVVVQRLKAAGMDVSLTTMRSYIAAARKDASAAGATSKRGSNRKPKAIKTVLGKSQSVVMSEPDGASSTMQSRGATGGSTEVPILAAHTTHGAVSVADAPRNSGANLI